MLTIMKRENERERGRELPPTRLENRASSGVTI